jgi:holo-[acyl-carrier-protein] synthase
MIYGIGIDIVNIERIKEVVEKWGQKFLQRAFTIDEISYCYQKKVPYISLAVRFAAKEALIKALNGTTISFIDIEIINTESGKPTLKVNEKLEHIFKRHSIHKAHLSLSHEHDYGVACVILEQ